MKIIYINTVYGAGSTGKITASLYELSRSSGYETLTAYGRGRTPSDLGIDGLRIGNKIDFGTHVLKNFFLGQSGFGSAGVTRRLISWLEDEKPDLLHLHNLHGFYVHIGLLFEYIKSNDIPVVWTLHDCWAFTGNCAFFDRVGCEKWKDGCHDCPIYRCDYPYSLFKDNSKNNYIIKKEVFTGVKNMTIITPCNWLKELIGQSFLSGYHVETIYNGVDTSVFSEGAASGVLDGGLRMKALEGKRILLGVAGIWEARKGLQYMLDLSDEFNPSNGYQVVIIGLSKAQCSKIKKNYGDRVMTVERTRDQAELAAWYKTSYAYINPTLQDNFPTTNIEALSCGTPVITFNTGGSPEAIGPECGFVVPKEDFAGLCNAIRAIRSIDNDDSKQKRTAYAARFDQKRMLDEYLGIYKKMLE